MFAFKLRQEITIRVLLILAILLNALPANPVTAQAEQETAVNNAQSNSQQLTKQGMRSIPQFERPTPRTADRHVNETLKSLPISDTGNHAANFASQNQTSPSIMFIENVGQFDSRARFQVRGGEATLFLADDAIWFTYLEPEKRDPKADPHDRMIDQLETQKPHKGVNLKVVFQGSNPHAEIVPFNKVNIHFGSTIERVNFNKSRDESR